MASGDALNPDAKESEDEAYPLPIVRCVGPTVLLCVAVMVIGLSSGAARESLAPFPFGELPILAR